MVLAPKMTGKMRALQRVRGYAGLWVFFTWRRRQKTPGPESKGLLVSRAFFRTLGQGRPNVPSLGAPLIAIRSTRFDRAWLAALTSSPD